MADELILVFEDDGRLDLIFEDEDDLSLEIGNGEPLAPAYTGTYVVTPRIATEQILETDGRLMADNVTVHEIPVTHTANPYGGKTVLIG